MKRLARLVRFVARRSLVALAAAAIAIGSTQLVLAQSATPQPPIGEDAALYLVRTTLIAVQQANETGNYTVLRDLGAPGFREANDAARLSEIFASLRASAVDLSFAALVPPTFSEPPRLTEENMLYLAGTLPTGETAVAFELLFEPVNGSWRLFGVGVNPTVARAETNSEPGRPESELPEERPETEIAE